MGEPIVVGRVGRAHGIRGEVTVEVRTDVPDRRFAPGASLDRTPPEAGPLVVMSARPHKTGWVVHFEGVNSREAAERLRGLLLTVDVDATGDAGEDAWWDHQLVGLTVVGVDGTVVGTVEDVRHVPAVDVLAVRRADGGVALVPFVAAIVPEVDVAAGRLVVDPPAGLLELE